MRIELTAVVLRCPEPEDAEKLHEYRNDWDVARHFGGFSTGMSRRDVLDWIERVRQQRNDVVWVIADKRDGTCLGHVGLYQVDHRRQLAELGIAVGAKACWGRGIGKDVCSAAARFGFRELNLHQIRLEVLETNARALSLYERLGFRRDGRLRHNQFRDGVFVDSVIMSMLRDEWEERNRA